MKTLRISHCESTFTTPTGGPSGLVRYNNVFHNSKLLLRSHDRSTPAFRHSSRLLLAEAESPPHFFFSFRCNKPSSLCSSIVCIPLYFTHVLFCCIEVVWNSLFPCGDWDAATGPETLMNGAILDFQHAPWRGSSDGVVFNFHVLRRCWYSVSRNVLL